MELNSSYTLVNSAVRAPSRNSITSTCLARANGEPPSNNDSSTTSLDVREEEFGSQPTRLALRKKPKSIFITSASAPDAPPAHMRRLSGISRTLSFPSFHSPSEPENPRPSSAHSAYTPSTPKLTPSTGSSNRSPSQKRRPPASHSSYGVETTLGPPPSYSTQQRTQSQDRLRVQGSQKAGTVAPQLNEVATTSKQQSRDVPADQHLTALPVLRSSDPDSSSPETLNSQAFSTPGKGSDITPPTSAGGTNMTESGGAVNKGLGVDGAHDDAKASSSDETQKSEDLFLNIAKTDASRPDKRRSRISLPFFSGSRPATAAATSSPMSAQFDSHLAPRSARAMGKRSSLGQHVPGALTSSSYFDDSRSYAGRPSDLRSTVDSIDSRSQIRSRRHSNANTESLRPPTRSRTSRLASENLNANRFGAAEKVATESTISTTAPSTVWDELDDLKSRIRKLELTGKLPPSSAAAMTSTERPRTATTAATTMSSSPKHNNPPVTSLPSAIEGVSSTVHPLLHEALTNAKANLNQEVYQKLQATAQDALHLSSMLSQEGFGSNGSALSPQTERQLRRRTESMCRGLTELAIAMLTDNRGINSPAARPSSREQHTGSALPLRTRTYSNDMPSERPSISTRVQSRLDSRRTSLLIGQAHAASPSTESPAAQSSFRTPAATVVSGPGSSSRVARTSTATRSRRSQAHSFLDGATDNEDEPSPSVAARPVSRAATEVGSTYRSLARERANFSREYTKQHPLPTQQAAADTPPASTRKALPSHITIGSRLASRRAFAAPSTDGEIVSPSHIENSSPITTPPHYTPQTRTPTHIARQPFTISIERRNAQLTESATNSPVTTSTPESMVGSGSDRRPSSTRRSLGFASRISNVSNRLKAARAERAASGAHTPANIAAVRSPLGGKETQLADTLDLENTDPRRQREAVAVQGSS
jgi:hypothetical protein